MISVLFIDDEQALLDIGKQFLERSGELQVEVITSPQAALALIAVTKFDAIVSDYQLPEMDGIALLKEVRSRNPEIPFILFTGKGREEVVIDAINNGADFYLQKEGDPKSQFVELEHRIIQAVQHRKVNMALQESERRYRTVFENTGTAMVVIEEDTTISLCNAEFVRLSGYAQEEINGKMSWTRFVVDKDIRQMLAQHQKRREPEGDALNRYEFQLKTKTGQIRDILLSVAIIPDSSRSIASLIDITPLNEAAEERKRRAERSIQYQKALVNLAIMDAPKLRDAMNNITETGANVLKVERVSIWFFSVDGQALVCNDLFTASRRQHDSGQTILCTDYPRYFAALQDNRAVVAADALTDENTRELTAGHLAPLGITSMLDVLIRSGRHVVGILCFEHTGPARSWDLEEQDFAASLADFTVIVLEKARRRLAEKDLQKSRDRSRITQFAVEHAAEGIVWMDSDGKVVYTNATCCAMLGYTGNEMLQMTIFAIDPAMSKAEWDAQYAQKKAGGSLTFETHYTKKGGEQFPVEVTSDYFEYAGTGYICSFVRDISERKRAEKALRIANEKLNLLSSVTRHDILNRLTVVLGYLELSKMTHDREKLEDFIRKIDETIRVIQDQIQFTRDYQDMGVNAPEWQDAESVFTKSISQLDLGAVRIHNDLAGLLVFADPLLERVIYNLVDNALRYGEKITTIRTRYQKNSDGLVWIIEDDGVGIPAKNKSLIFNKGFGKHSGLGLFLAREILSITGMIIMETGFPGTGARFEIHIPRGGFRFA